MCITVTHSTAACFVCFWACLSLTGRLPGEECLSPSASLIKKKNAVSCLGSIVSLCLNRLDVPESWLMCLTTAWLHNHYLPNNDGCCCLLTTVFSSSSSLTGLLLLPWRRGPRRLLPLLQGEQRRGAWARSEAALLPEQERRTHLPAGHQGGCRPEARVLSWHVSPHPVGTVQINWLVATN